MSITRSIAVAAAAALLAVPSAAVAVGPPADPGGDHKPAGTPTPAANPSADHPTQTGNPGLAHPTADPRPGTAATEPPGPHAPAAAKARAYGKYCQGESKKHVAGEKGAPFSECVTAMAKAASGEAHSGRAACAGVSRKHTAGKHGTPYSRCVAAAKSLVDQPKEEAAGA
jgi:hypothetical protein